MNAAVPDLAAVLRVLNSMREQKIISRYAIGGAVAAIFYVEPRETFDLDIFFILEQQPSNDFLRLETIYDFARTQNFEIESEFIRIHGWAVQFFESETPLWKKAVETAREVRFETVETFVIAPEYLATMMVEAGRNKDWIRLADFWEAEILDKQKFLKILEKFDLSEKWKKHKWRFETDERQS
ncbi:MAG: hypothetical protein ACR2N3_08745 [Pyrinomonadaceae bacterium]